MRTTAFRTIMAFVSCVALVCAVIATGAPWSLPGLAALQATPAYAEGTGDSDGSHGTNGGITDDSTALTVADGASSTSASDTTASLTITASTPIVGPADSSTAPTAYSLTVTVSNPTDTAIDAGTVEASMNPDVAFSTTEDMQSWAEGALGIWAAGVIATADVGRLEPGASQTVTLTNGTSEYPFNECSGFGARPVLVSFDSDDGATHLESHTFVTYDDESALSGSGSSDGSTGDGTSDDSAASRVTLAIAAPVTAQSWTTDSDTLASVTAAREGSDLFSVTSPQLTPLASAAIDAKAKHTEISLVSDPLCLGSVSSQGAAASAAMQPAAADITAMAQTSSDWSAAGIDSDSVSAASAANLAQSGSGSQNGAQSGSAAPSASGTDSAQPAQSAPLESIESIAWQGRGSWTAASLGYAHDAGYSTVVSTSGNTGTDRDSYAAVASAGTASGSVTVLNAESTMSSLLSGQASSDQADGETTASGRINRLIAQSALGLASGGSALSPLRPASDDSANGYTRLFVALSDAASATNDDLDAMLSALESAHWVSFQSLDDFIASAPAATASIPTDTGLDQSESAYLSSTATALASSRTSMSRFFTSVIDPEKGQNTDPSQDNPQALSRQDAQQTAHISDNAQVWETDLTTLHTLYGLHALDISIADGVATTKDAENLASSLFANVSIQQPNSVVMMSTTASLPVTIVNNTPYPVTVSVDARSGATILSVEDSDSITVAGRSEQQVTLPLTAYSSGSTYVGLRLLDAQGAPFNSELTVTVSNSLRLNDQLGYGIIAFAVLLTIGGLWRQFHRKKDTDS